MVQRSLRPERKMFGSPYERKVLQPMVQRYLCPEGKVFAFRYGRSRVNSLNKSANAVRRNKPLACGGRCGRRDAGAS